MASGGMDAPVGVHHLKPIVTVTNEGVGKKSRLAGIGALLESYGLLHQLYADDVQAYTHCTSDQAVAAVAQMYLATDALSAWLASNRLLLNASKTQFIWLGGGRRLAGVDRSSVAIAFPHICFQDSV